MVEEAAYGLEKLSKIRRKCWYPKSTDYKPPDIPKFLGEALAFPSITHDTPKW